MDGTLLHTDGKITDTSYNILQPLIDRGLSFAVATGRTRDNAIGALSPLKLTLPLICDNGTFIYDIVKKEFLLKKIIKADDAAKAVELIHKNGVYPFVNTLEGNSITVFHSKLANTAQKNFYTQRSLYGLSQYVCDHSYTDFKDKDAFNISMLDSFDKLIDLYNVFDEDENLTALMFPAHYFADFYWLEILPANSGKGQSIDFLKEKYNPKKIVCFGDNLNDLCMFERADVKVAPINAVKEVKEAADIIIGHCDDDSVAEYIKEIN